MNYKEELRLFSSRLDMTNDIDNTIHELQRREAPFQYKYREEVVIVGNKRIQWRYDHEPCGKKVTQQIQGLCFTSAYIDMFFDKSVIRYVASRMRSADYPLSDIRVFIGRIRDEVLL